MEKDPIQKILESRRPAGPPPAPAETAEEGSDKFYSIPVGDAVEQHFLELRFNTGMKSCFAYGDLSWFNFDPESSTIDLEFGGFLVTVKGRGLGEAVFDGIKRKRVAYLKEADVPMQNHDGNRVFIEAISITPPGGGGNAEEEAAT